MSSSHCKDKTTQVVFRNQNHSNNNNNDNGNEKTLTPSSHVITKSTIQLPHLKSTSPSTQTENSIKKPIIIRERLDSNNSLANSSLNNANKNNNNKQNSPTISKH